MLCCPILHTICKQMGTRGADFERNGLFLVAAALSRATSLLTLAVFTSIVALQPYGCKSSEWTLDSSYAQTRCVHATLDPSSCGT